MDGELLFMPHPAAVAAAACARGAASSPCAPLVAGCKRPWGEAAAHSDIRSCCSLGTGLNFCSMEDLTQCAWPECETCGKQDLLHLSCRQCASPVCGDCVGGKCGVCGADLQRAFRGCDLCGRVFRRRGTRMCVHCTETWCFSCIDRVGTCGCGELTEEGFLMPLEQVEAPPTAHGPKGPAQPCLSTASSCNLAACVADTATSDPAADDAAAAREPSGAAGALQQQRSEGLGAEALFGDDGDDDAGPQWSSNGGSCCA